MNIKYYGVNNNNAKIIIFTKIININFLIIVFIKLSLN